MEHLDIFKIPENPKLKFGEPLSDVCGNGVFHGGLKDLFLKAYLSAKGDDAGAWTNEAPNDDNNKLGGILLALKSGRDGQGSLHQRISLMTKLEAGQWLMPVQTPAGAPLWLLRHFLGRLPQPLLQGSHWKRIGETCGASALSSPEEVLERISVSAKALSRPEFEVLALLTLLIKRLSLIEEQRDEEELRNDVLYALSEYFIASIITRPYRPGLCTKLDKKCQPLLIFLSRNWNAIFQQTSDPAVFDHLAINKKLQKSISAELHSYFRNNCLHSKQMDNRSYSKFIGFEPLLIEETIKQTKKKSEHDNDIKPKSSFQRNAFDNLSELTNDSVLTQSSSAESLSEIDKLEHFESDSVNEKNPLRYSKLTENNNIETHIGQEDDLLLNKKSSTSVLWRPRKGPSSNISSKNKPNVKSTEANIKLRKRAPRHSRFSQNLLINRLDKLENIVNTSSTECEFYSIPNSENSD